MSQVREPPFLPSPKGGGFRAAISVTEHQKAEEAVLRLLGESPQPRGARELVGIAYRRGLGMSADLIRLATWTLLEKGRLRFAPGRRLELADNAG